MALLAELLSHNFNLEDSGSVLAKEILVSFEHDCLERVSILVVDCFLLLDVYEQDAMEFLVSVREFKVLSITQCQHHVGLALIHDGIEREDLGLREA